MESMNLINWQDLPIEKNSILNISNGKYVETFDKYNHPFMLCVGIRKNAYYLYLIEKINGFSKRFICGSFEEADEFALRIIGFLLQGNGVMTIIKGSEKND